MPKLKTQKHITDQQTVYNLITLGQISSIAGLSSRTGDGLQCRRRVARPVRRLCPRYDCWPPGEFPQLKESPPASFRQSDRSPAGCCRIQTTEKLDSRSLALGQ